MAHRCSRSLRGALAAVGAACMLVLAGCTVDISSSPTPSPTPARDAAAILHDTCDTASGVLSALYNADVGLYASGEGLYNSTMTADDWVGEVDGARTMMAALAKADNGDADSAITDLNAAVRAIPTRPTMDYTATEATAEASRELNAVCTANNTEIIITAQYGG